MADPSYRSFPFLFNSRGITARFVDDQAPESTAYLNLANAEELAEGAISNRLGSIIINTATYATDPLSGLVHSLSRLGGLTGSAWRYAGANGNLYRRPLVGLGLGPYDLIASTLSGQPWQSIVFASDYSSTPYLFIADAKGMLKDNGTLAQPQQLGILQPQYPVQAQALSPDLIVLDDYSSPNVNYRYSGVSQGVSAAYVNTTLTSPVTITGVQFVSVQNPQQVGLFQVLNVGSEQVLAIQVTPTGLAAKFTQTHPAGTAVTNQSLSVTVGASTTATVSKSFAGEPIQSWPTILSQDDYIGLYLFVNDPTQIQSITLKFDCGDGSFNSDYFYKVIGQGPFQSLTDNTTDPTTAATDAALSESLGLYGNASGSIAELNTGLNVWTALLNQLSGFSGSGRASFADPVFNWNNVNGYQVEIVTNDTASATVSLSSLVLFGGAGPDSFGGVAYDWLFTFFNNADGTESNPCMVMSNMNPPLQTNWITPRRQPVQLTLTYPKLDPQTTSMRIYRRGGTLGDNYRRVDEVLIAGSPQQYVDISADADIQQASLISFENDVPVTSSLPTPVNTTLKTAIAGTNAVVSVYPVNIANISVSQQVDIGSAYGSGPINNFEVVVVLSVSSDHFTAFVQNAHLAGETVAATAKYVQPVTIMTAAFDQVWYAGDPNNPSYLYWSAKSNGQAVSSAAYVVVSTPDDPITAIVQFKGNLYVSTVTAWWSVAPGSNAESGATVYPTACQKGCVAPLGYVATEEAIYYQACDGTRVFAGGGSTLLTQNQQFIFDDSGVSPIVEADTSKLDRTRAAIWNTMLFFSYVGVDGNRHRLIYNMSYTRWRNDDVPATAMLLERETNTLLYGDPNGLIHKDRAGSYDQGIVNGVLGQVPIEMNVQLPYMDMGMPTVQKSYAELTVDADTGGQDLAVTLLFNDGQESLVLGPVNTSERQRVNLNIQNGLGYQAYKVSLNLTASTTKPITIYQCAIRALGLARTRKSLDTFWMKQGSDASKLAKDFYVEYDATLAVTGEVFYDQSPNPRYTFNLPPSVRQSLRVRFPAIKYRLMRIVLTCDGDFRIWNDTNIQIKPLLEGSKGYQINPLTPDE